MIGDRDTDLAIRRTTSAFAGLRSHRMARAMRPGRRSCAPHGAPGPVERKTKETDISVDGQPRCDRTDSMSPPASASSITCSSSSPSTAVSRSSCSCQGDLQIDEHHTVEDCAFALGEALRRRLAQSWHRALWFCCRWMRRRRRSPSICRDARMRFEGNFTREAVGGLPTELVPHFFRSLADAWERRFNQRHG